MKRCLIASMVVLAGLMATGGAAAGKSGDLLAQVDHLVYATPDLNAGIATLERLLGVRATAGGQHPGLGTRNALIALGPASYIEIIGPDPDQAKPKGPRRFGIDDLKVPMLITWVAKGSQLERLAADARLHGVDLARCNREPEEAGTALLLSWRYTDPKVVVANRIVPYLSIGETSPHPALTAAKGASLLGLRAEHPEVRRVQNMPRSAWTRSPITTRIGARAHCDHQQSQWPRGTRN